MPGSEKREAVVLRRERRRWLKGLGLHVKYMFTLRWRSTGLGAAAKRICPLAGQRKQVPKPRLPCVPV